jgi:hypothetical protein
MDAVVDGQMGEKIKRVSRIAPPRMAQLGVGQLRKNFDKIAQEMGAFLARIIRIGATPSGDGR